MTCCERNASLAYVTALALHERIVARGIEEADLCAAIGDLATAADLTWYLVDAGQEIVCADPDARLRPGTVIDYDLDEPVTGLDVADLRSRRYSASLVLIPDTRWGLGLIWLAQHILSTEFADLDSTQSFYQFYNELYGLDVDIVNQHIIPLVQGEVVIESTTE